MSDQKNLAIAVAISVLIIFTFDRFFAPEQTVTVGAPANTEASEITAEETTPFEPVMQEEEAKVETDSAVVANVPAANREEIIKNDNRIKIKTPSIEGSIRLKGARIDDVTLLKYKQTMDKDSENVVLLSPVDTKAPYYMEFGWVAAKNTPVTLPDKETEWKADSDTLSPENPVTLTWENGKGQKFIRTYSVDENYMFQIKQEIENNSDKDITLFPYGLISKIGIPEEQGRSISHQGPIGVFNQELEETTYEELQKTENLKFTTTGGWLGITDKYWLAALVFDQKLPKVTTRFNYRNINSLDRFQTDYLAPPMTVKAGEKADINNSFFAGAKEISLLDEYSVKNGIDRFDLAIDFGWYYFLTKPFFYVLKFLYGHLGNFGLAILAGTILLRLAMYPLADKSFRNMSKMKKIQPKVAKLHERFDDDKVRLNQELMALYKKEKVNPAAGCLPMFIQIPVFFSLYKVLYISIEMRHAPFYGWITDLSAPDPICVFNLGGLIPFDPPSFLSLGVWPLLMGATMFIQQKLNPKPADDTQAKMMAFMPLFFMFLLANFPAGLVIYWTWSNLLSIIQQRYIMHRMGVEP